MQLRAADDSRRLVTSYNQKSPVGREWKVSAANMEDGDDHNVSVNVKQMLVAG